MNHVIIRIVLFLLCTVSLVNTKAQTQDSIDVCQFVVGYDYKWNTQDKDGNAVSDSLKFAVEVGTKVTKFKEYYNAMVWDFRILTRENKDGAYYSKRINTPTIFINYPEGEMRSFDVLIPSRFVVEGAIPAINWNLEADTITIAEHLCHKATGEYAGRKWIAWYTEEIASTAGPWKLRGLPGLILKAEDSEHIHSFECFEIRKIQAPISYKEILNPTKIKQKDFIKQRNKIFCNKRYVQNPRYYIPDAVMAQTSEMWHRDYPKPPLEERLTILASDMIIPKTANVYQPLELE